MQKFLLIAMMAITLLSLTNSAFGQKVVGTLVVKATTSTTTSGVPVPDGAVEQPPTPKAQTTPAPVVSDRVNINDLRVKKLTIDNVKVHVDRRSGNVVADGARPASHHVARRPTIGTSPVVVKKISGLETTVYGGRKSTGLVGKVAKIDTRLTDAETNISTLNENCTTAQTTADGAKTAAEEAKAMATGANEKINSLAAGIGLTKWVAWIALILAICLACLAGYNYFRKERTGVSKDELDTLGRQVVINNINLKDQLEGINREIADLKRSINTSSEPDAEPEATPRPPFDFSRFHMPKPEPEPLAATKEDLQGAVDDAVIA